MPERTRPTVEEARRTAAEAWIWGHPLLAGYRNLYAEAVDPADPRSAGGFGRFRHDAGPLAPAGADLVHSTARLDLRAEPWVLSVPATDRYHLLAVHDLDTVHAGFVGSGATGREAGHHLVAGPGWTGPVPDGVSGVLRTATRLVGVLGRTHLAGPDDVPALRAVQEGYRLRPLSEFTDTAAPHPAEEPVWPVWREEETDTVEFLTLLDFLLRFFPVLDADRDLRARLAALGVDGGGAFEPAALSPELRAALEAGIADGRARLTEAAAATPRPAGLHGTRAELAADPLRRALAAHQDPYGLPDAQVWRRDPAADGPPDGSRHAYALRFAPGQLPPARFFWSASLAGLPDGRFAENEIDRYAIGDRTPGILYDDDGGLTLYVAHRRPTDPERAANWLPAPAGPFSVTLRLHGPDPSVLAGRWPLPRLTRDDGADG
ncbi:DUF1254 domain-containing protein [Streptomyces sp. NRRL F-5727]|uniref:DUF1254 domain-containing protein n=1 Tax=Streptomyces sp. NRRL F-5727 TaxID=1463871 RepID=UPI0006917E97|nr:DUF1254 domain-containing protein [Streptomyces sp. NRRL F-5727]